MKILVLTTKSPWPPRDGSAVASKSIIEGLSGHGADITVLSIITQKHEAVKDHNPKGRIPVALFRRFFIDTTIRPMALVRNLLFTHVPYDLERFHSARFMSVIRSLPDLPDYDVIQCEGLAFALYVPWLREATSARIVLRAHNIEHHIREMMAADEFFFLSRWYLRLLARRIKTVEASCRRLFDAVVTITDNDKEWFDRQRGDAPVIVAPAGVTFTSSPVSATAKRLSVGFIGALDWTPNIRGLQWFLKEVWPLVTDKIPDATLFVAGRNASAATAARIRGTNVFFSGEVADATAFTTAVSVMIAPLFAGSGMRVKIIEAMNAGVPVVATSVAASGIDVTDRKDIMLADSNIDFASAVCHLLTNPAEHDRIAASAREMVHDNYDNNRITSHLMGFYKVLTNGR